MTSVTYVIFCWFVSVLAGVACTLFCAAWTGVLFPALERLLGLRL